MQIHESILHYFLYFYISLNIFYFYKNTKIVEYDMHMHASAWTPVHLSVSRYRVGAEVGGMQWWRTDKTAQFSRSLLPPKYEYTY